MDLLVIRKLTDGEARSRVVPALISSLSIVMMMIVISRLHGDRECGVVVALFFSACACGMARITRYHCACVLQRLSSCYKTRPRSRVTT